MPEKDEKGGLVRAGTGALQKISSDIVSRGLNDLALLENRMLQIKQQQTIKCEKDGSEMVLIPAGEFQMGDALSDVFGSVSKYPVYIVYLDAFYMDKYEVTNAQYKKFMDAKEYKAPKYWNDSRFNAPNHPVVGVSWNDAVAYADWAGKRLPTEAEWEKAARGGLVGKRYPLGDTLTHDDANIKSTGGKDIWRYTSPVGSFAPNGYGLFDMIGNVWEWCDRDYNSSSDGRNLGGPSWGSSHVLRGGSWDSGLDSDLSISPQYCDDTPQTDADGKIRSGAESVGFRCVQDVPKQ